ncbi:hypothetical protein [Micromonospora pisi]|uniref:hypothetical protein n=1 Tax=Micromonospora pisi TaxID=589240 RepID=UPI0014775AE3|nr:hypothetical protein [Micromonospora pisi]
MTRRKLSMRLVCSAPVNKLSSRAVLKSLTDGSNVTAAANSGQLRGSADLDMNARKLCATGRPPLSTAATSADLALVGVLSVAARFLTQDGGFLDGDRCGLVAARRARGR